MDESLKTAKRIVVKVGTSVLTEPGKDRLSPARVRDIAQRVGEVHRAGREVIVVTSGAIAAGMDVLGYRARPKDLHQLQAASAVGQWRLMSLYEQAFGQQNFHAAQMLLTNDDLKHRRQNIKATLNTLLERRVIPVINENDSVSTEEIRVGDNDQLAAHVAVLAGADLLIILTDVNGLRNDAAQVVQQVSRAELNKAKQWARGTDKATSAGGMRTKLLAAELVTDKNIRLAMADGSSGGYVLTQIALEGKNPGTLFTP